MTEKSTQLDFDKLDRLAKFLETATPEQIHKIAEDMATKRPDLFPVSMTDDEIAEAMQKMGLADDQAK